jgi:hypothetical protein
MTAAATRSALLESLVWIIVILAVFIPAAIYRYRHTTAR